MLCPRELHRRKEKKHNREVWREGPQKRFFSYSRNARIYSTVRMDICIHNKGCVCCVMCLIVPDGLALLLKYQFIVFTYGTLLFFRSLWTARQIF